MCRMESGNMYMRVKIGRQIIIYTVRVSLCMVAYFCHHLSDNYVDLTDLYVVLSDLYGDLSDLSVDLSHIHLLESK